MISLWNVGTLRDYWPRPDAASIENVEWLQKVDCFRPKFYAVPIQGAIDIAANGYIVNTLAMVPGAWLLGFSHVNASTLDIQVTDISTNYKLFNTPTSVDLFSSSGGYFSPFLLPEPYMMAGNALLRVEVFNSTAVATANSQIVLHVLEPREV